MKESSNLNFDSFIKSHQPKEKEKKQYLNDWSHLHLSQESCPVSYQKIIMKHYQTTRTTHAIVSIILPETSKVPGSLNRKASSVIFWSSILAQNTPEINLSEVKNAIKRSYASLYTKINLDMSIDLQKELTSFLKDSNVNKDLNKRTIVHFISDLSLEFNSSHKKDEQFRQLREIIKSTYHCGLHIIDCNQAGIYYPCYQEILKDTEFTMQHKDLFVFFSCLENQKIPKFPGLPNDLFSSFLISPIKTALLFHSMHYFGFNNSLNFNDYSISNKNTNQQNHEEDQWDNRSSQLIYQNSLSPLTIEQINEAPKSLLDNLMNTLRHLVEAMFCESEFYSLFLKLDDTVAQIFIGFAAAQHFMNMIQIKPFTYPSIPETIANHPLWSTFDLRLDAALMTLTYGRYFNSIDIKNNDEENDTENSKQTLSNLYNMENIPFTQQELQTIKLLMESDSPLSEFAGHITFMSDCLKEPNLMKESIDILADFIEKHGLPGIQLASKFSIFPSLVQIAKNTVNDRKTKPTDIDIDKLILCMSKLYVFYPNAKDLVPFFNNQYLTSFTVFHLRSENPLPSLVLFTLMLKLSDASMITLFLKCNWLSITECLIQSSNEEVRIWTLLLVSSFAHFVVLIDQTLQLLDAISIAVDDTSPSVRVAFLVALQSIPFANSVQIESSVLEIALKLMNDLHPAVRRELASLLVSMKILQKATSLDTKASFNDKMTPSTSMSTSDFFSESGSDANLEATANGTNFVDSKKKAKSKANNISSFSFSTKSEINKILSSQETAADESNANPQNQKIILNALKQLSTDPFKGVTVAALIHDDETQRNFTFMQFFNNYISPSNSPCMTLSSSSFLSLSKIHSEPQLKSSSSGTQFPLKFTLTTDYKRAKIESLFSSSNFVVNSNSPPNVSSNQVITSNVTFSTFDDHLIFGTDDGFVISYPLTQQSPPNGQNIVNGFMSQTPITHVQCDDNNGFPLLLISSNSGDFYAGDFSGFKNSGSDKVQKKLPILTSFRVFLNLHSNGQHHVTTTPNKSRGGMYPHSLLGGPNLIQYDFCEPAKRSYEFEFDSQDSLLYFYAPKMGCNVNVCDLTTEQKIGEIISLNDNVTSVNSPSWLSNCVVICNESLYIYDCRTSLDSPVVSYAPMATAKAFNCRTVRKEHFTLPICTNGGSVLYDDMRMIGQSGVKHLAAFDSPFVDAQSLCFDVSQETLAAAVGTTKGGYACFYPSDKKIVIPSKARQVQKIFRLKWMKNRTGLVIMQNYTDVQSCIFS